MPLISKIGTNTAMSDMLMETTVKPISRAPFSAASIGFIPRSRCRVMFSITTTASSTRNPVEIVRAINERLSRLYPNRYITANVPTSAAGTEMLGISITRPFRRNRNTTKMASATERISVLSASRTDARIPSVRSITVVKWMAGGIDASSAGSAFRIRSTVPIMLAPGCR